MKWIPCSERLPSDDNDYLVVDGDGEMAVGYYRDDADAWDNSCFGWLERDDEDEHPTRLGKVVAWMPLPKPYTADRKTEPSGYKMKPVEQTEPTMRLHEWTSDDITFCTAECECKCYRKPRYIKHKDIPHSFADLSEVCKEYEPKQTEPQTITIVKDHGRKQALEMTDLYYKLKDEPQTERSEND